MLFSRVTGSFFSFSSISVAPYIQLLLLLLNIILKCWKTWTELTLIVLLCLAVWTHIVSGTVIHSLFLFPVIYVFFFSICASFILILFFKMSLWRYICSALVISRTLADLLFQSINNKWLLLINFFWNRLLLDYS